MGEREDGTPYYTMKRVPGRALRKALDEAESLSDRLALLPHFVDLCQADADPDDTPAHENLARQYAGTARYAAKQARLPIAAKAYEESIAIFRELNGRESKKGSYTREIERLVSEQKELGIAPSHE